MRREERGTERDGKRGEGGEGDRDWKRREEGGKIRGERGGGGEGWEEGSRKVNEG